MDDEALSKEKECFRRRLRDKAEAIFETALPSVPCASIFRPRAARFVQKCGIGSPTCS